MTIKSLTRRLRWTVKSTVPDYLPTPYTMRHRERRNAICIQVTAVGKRSGYDLSLVLVIWRACRERRPFECVPSSIASSTKVSRNIYSQADSKTITQHSVNYSPFVLPRLRRDMLSKNVRDDAGICFHKKNTIIHLIDVVSSPNLRHRSSASVVWTSRPEPSI